MPVWVGWLGIGAIGVVDGIWILAGGYRVTWPSEIAVMFPIGLAIGAVCCRTRLPGVSRRSNALAQNMTGALAFGLFSYLCATPDFPLMDNWLGAADRALGFDWDWWYAIATQTPVLNEALFRLYFLVWGLQTFLLVFLLPVLSPRRNTELMVAAVFCVFATGLLEMLVPAQGALFHSRLPIDLSHHRVLVTALHDLMALRDGSMKTIDLAAMHGIVAFPSFHTSAAIIYVYVIRGKGLLSHVWATLNTALMFSIPVWGGHYLTDMIGGALVALAAIALVRALERRFGGAETPARTLLRLGARAPGWLGLLKPARADDPRA